MDVEQTREYCMTKKGATESLPFDEDTLVFKVCGKIFAYMSLEDATVSMKCDPERVIELREEYSYVQGAPHMNKRMWIMALLNEVRDSKLLYEWIDHSYDLVVQKLTRAQKAELEKMK